MTPDEAFAKALSFTLSVEGGFTVDNGGPTQFGVTQTVYDAWREKQNQEPQSVKNITLDEAKSLYRSEYWAACKLDELAMIDGDVAVAAFDTAVNSGNSRAIKILQRIVCPDAIDGVMGPGTLGMTRKAVMFGEPVVGPYLNERDAFYDRLAVQDKKYTASIKGWHNRVAALRKFLCI